MDGSRWQATQERSHRVAVASFSFDPEGVAETRRNLQHPAGVQHLVRANPVAAPSSLATGYLPPRLRRDGVAVTSKSSRRAKNLESSSSSCVD